MKTIQSTAIGVAIALSGCATPLPTTGEPIDPVSILGQWELERVDRRKVANAISLDFRTDGQVQGAIECNSFLTDYAISGQAIELGNAIITAAGCHPRFDADQRLVERAEAVLFAEPPATISGDGNALILRGTRVLIFQRVH